LSKNFSSLTHETKSLNTVIKDIKDDLIEFDKSIYERRYPTSLSRYGIPPEVTRAISRGEGQIVILEPPIGGKFGPECIRFLQDCKTDHQPIPYGEIENITWYCRYPRLHTRYEEYRKNSEKRVKFLSSIYSKRNKER
jgi:hypothetical protein